MMSHTIQLTEEHQRIVIESLLHSLEDKFESVIQDHSKYAETEQQYVSAAEKILKPITIHKRTSNLPLWVIDQLKHSPNIKNSELARRAMIICEAAIENRYQEFCRPLTIQ